MNAEKKLVDYSLSASDFEEDGPTAVEELTPILSKGKRVYRRIIRTPSPENGTTTAEELTPIHFKGKRVYRRIIRSPSPLSLCVGTARTNGRHRRSKKPPTKGGREKTPPPTPQTLADQTDDSKATKQTKKRWTMNECRRLKLALKITDPTTDSEWEAISRSIGGQRTAGECRAKATKQFGWEQPSLASSQKATTSKSTTTAEDGESDPFIKYFRDNVDFSLGELDLLDDTLLNEAYGTPTVPVKCMRRPFLLRPIDPFEDERAAKDSDEENY
ncbi:hypothetical protein niasHT_035533 [Heterodera trifolii]|uniref:Myb-like domain-containing protein n=1 Tax=Heterodera trifolii TaxID=157864 RepID=A0ABD2IJS8_9BILA